MKPSAHFAQHRELEAPRVDAAAFRPAWRVMGAADRLLADRAINRREWQRATAFARDVELVLASIYPEPPEVGMPATSRLGYKQAPASRHDAVARVERICQAIGAFACELLRACLVEDLTWTALGARFRVDRRTARRWAIDCIKALARAEFA